MPFMHDSLINEQEKAIQKWTLRNVKSAIPSPPVISASAFSDILMPSGLFRRAFACIFIRSESLSYLYS